MKLILWVAAAAAAFLISGCAVATDPKVYEEGIELIEEIVKDEQGPSK